jgi:hypothetical protein
MKEELPPNHKRILSVTVKIVEEEIEEMQQTLLMKNKGTIKNIISDYDDTERDKILDFLKQLKSLNEKMFKELELNSENVYASQIIKAKITYLWTILENSKSAALKGYGELPSGTANSIDGFISELLFVIKEIS